MLWASLLLYAFGEEATRHVRLTYELPYCLSTSQQLGMLGWRVSSLGHKAAVMNTSIYRIAPPTSK